MKDMPMPLSRLLGAERFPLRRVPIPNKRIPRWRTAIRQRLFTRLLYSFTLLGQLEDSGVLVGPGPEIGGWPAHQLGHNIGFEGDARDPARLHVPKRWVGDGANGREWVARAGGERLRGGRFCQLSVAGGVGIQ